MINTTKFSIGDIHIAIDENSPQKEPKVPPAYFPFIAEGESHIRLRLLYGKPAFLSDTKIFESPPIWSLYSHDDTTVIRIFEHMQGYGRTLVIPRDIKKTALYLDDPLGHYIDPFYGPTMELLMLNYLAQGRGVMIHGCGVKHNDRGILFVGESGAGKTTMARIWSRESGVDVLSDDRTIVRQKGDHYLMYGTPWHGEGKFGSPESVKLDQIFFINHGKENSILERNAAQAVTQFLKCSFPPLWDAEGMKFAMAVFSDLAAAVSCRELSFKPDRSIIDFVNRVE